MNGCWIAEETARKLESIYVHRVYSRQALTYEDLCDGPWPEIRNFLLKQPSGSHVADVGCGNGKYLNIRSDIVVHGSDICDELTQLAQTRHKDIIKASNLKLPYRSGSMDAAISIGVLHHIASSQRRLQCITELSRVLRPGGKLLIYVWAWEQKWRKFKAQDVLVPWTGNEVQQCIDKKSDKDLMSCVNFSANNCSNENEFLKDNICSPRDKDNSGSMDLTISCNDVEDSSKTSSSFTNSMSEVVFAIKERFRFFPFSKTKSTFDDKLETCVNSGHINGTCSYNREKCKLTRHAINQSSKLSEDDTFETCDEESREDKTSITVNGETWNKDNSIKDNIHMFHRFYHVFRKEELLELVKRTSNLNVVYQSYDHGNWTIIAEKLPI